MDRSVSTLRPKSRGEGVWVPAFAGTALSLSIRSPRERRLHHAAGLAKIHLPGVFRLQRRDHLAHVLHPGGIGLGDHGSDRRLDVGLRHLLRQIAGDDRYFLALLLVQFGTPALAVALHGFLALFYHLLAYAQP